MHTPSATKIVHHTGYEFPHGVLFKCMKLKLSNIVIETYYHNPQFMFVMDFINARYFITWINIQFMCMNYHVNS